MFISFQQHPSQQSGKHDVEVAQQVRVVVLDAYGATIPMGGDSNIASIGITIMTIDPSPLLRLIDTTAVPLEVKVDVGASATRARTLVLFADPRGIWPSNVPRHPKHQCFCTLGTLSKTQCHGTV